MPAKRLCRSPGITLPPTPCVPLCRTAQGACRLLGLLAASHHAHVAASASKGPHVMFHTLEAFLDDADAVVAACSALVALMKSRSVENIGAVATLMAEDPLIPKIVAAIRVHLRYSIAVVRTHTTNQRFIYGRVRYLHDVGIQEAVLARPIAHL